MAGGGNSRLLLGDVDSSLASLAVSLSVKPGTMNKGDLQWTAPTEKKLTGGNNFSGIRPASSTWSGAPQPQQQPMMQQQQQQPMFNPVMQQQQQFGYAMQPQQQNYMYQQPQPMMYNNPQMMGMAPPTYQAQPMMGQQPMMMQPMAMRPQTATNQQQPLDPFGNL